MADAFPGFPKRTVTFLRDLAAHNDRDWFAAHKMEYEATVMEPAKAFVLAMGERLRRLTPGVKAEPRTNGSLFRIHRDTRFSPDKSPYKTNLGIFFWEGGGPRLDCPGYYFHLEPPNLMLGGGLYIFSRPLLERYRRAVADPEYGAELAAIAKKIGSRPSYTLGGEHYKRVPAGYDADPAAEFLLRHAGLYAGWEGRIPVELHSPALLDFCFAKFKPMEPLHRWLVKLVKGEFES
ncbi:MAG: DUF2461 domain-containing protein [Acidobacteria bacterium]|jgi:uncharacterized protein (TIGR02453 family)|nr:DUF2461 domain-containing protein [Acidobacteriota bacterium]